MAMSKRKRARVIRWVQYGVLVAVILVVALTANWTKIRTTFFDLEVARDMFPEVITVALVNTVIYTALGFGFGLVLGLVLALMRLSSVRVYRWIAGIYIEFFRGLPALLVFLAVGFGIPLAFGTFLDKYVALMIALGIVASAYMAETLRAGIQAVPRGQVEAARSLGMSPARTMVTIVIPQAFKIILPPLTNELILLTKDSSLALFLGASVVRVRADPVRPGGAERVPQPHAGAGRRRLLPDHHDPALLPVPVPGAAHQWQKISMPESTEVKV